MVPHLPPMFTKKVLLCRYNPHHKYQLIRLDDTVFPMAIIPYQEDLIAVNPRSQRVQYLDAVHYAQYFKGTTDRVISVDAFDGFDKAPLISDIFGVVDAEGEVGEEQYVITNIKKYPKFQIFIMGLIGSEVPN